jgi:hypothetical protein
VVLAVEACLPDLPGAKGQAEGGGTPPCGDGYIDIDAGEQCDPGQGQTDAGAGGCNANCRMECNGGLVWDQNNHCYFGAGAAPSLGAAGTTCGPQAAAHVVTFGSEAEYGEVRAFFELREGGTDPFWVGLSPGYVSVFDYEPGWGPTCSGCYSYTEDASAPLPAFALPPDSGQNEPCVVAISDASSWEQYPCARMAGTRVICEREPVGQQIRQCDAGFCIDLVYTHATKRYVYQPAPVTAAQAVASCAALGGKLVVLASREEREQLWRQLSLLSVPPTTFWIGLTLLDAGAPDAASTWKWDDGTLLEDVPDAHPSPWGDFAPTPSGPYKRAYMAYLGMNLSRDNTLAHNSGVGIGMGPLPATVCEVAP